MNDISDLTNPLRNSPLGKTTGYGSQYDKSLLVAIPRQMQREQLIIGQTLPFTGVDIWNAYELSWLNPQGKPMVAMAQIKVPCESPCIFESKSLKLYLNSFNNSVFESLDEVQAIILQDLSQTVKADIKIILNPLASVTDQVVAPLSGYCLDGLMVETNQYTVNTDFLSCQGDEIVNESLTSNLLRSNCLVTGQPDWATVQIQYHGKQINHQGLLKYIISYRNHVEFAEHCVERIFTDITNHCQVQSLSVLACYTRRGGIDINPYRSTENNQPEAFRLPRQ